MTASRNLRDTVARKAAKASGSPRYFTGRPCTNGHIAERQTANGSCLACVALKKSAADAKHYEKNADKIKQNVREWREANRDHVLQYDSNRWFANHEQNLQLCKVRSARHTEKRRLNREFDHFMAQLEAEEAVS